MTKFLNVPQSRICRFDSACTTETITGLYTDAFSECNIVILYKQSAGVVRISMIHADLLVRPEHLSAELAWIGEGATGSIYSKNNDRADNVRKVVLSDELSKQFKSINCPDEIFGLSINTSGTVEFHKRENIPPLATHPEEWKFHSIFELNLAFTTFNAGKKRSGALFFDYKAPCYQALQVTHLLFDGENWKELSKHDQEFTPLAESFINQLRIVSSRSNQYSKMHAMQVVEKFFSAMKIPGLDPLSEVLLVTHGLLLITENNYQRIFNDELRLMIEKLPALGAPENELQFLRTLSEATRENFETFSEFLDPVKTLRTPKISSCLQGIYKLCKRLKAHDAGLVETRSVAMIP